MSFKTETTSDTKPRDFEIITNYELLIKNTQAELDFYKKEQSKLRSEALNILQENQTEYADIRQNENFRANVSKEEHEKLTNEAIYNLKTQVRHLTDERDTLNSLWKTSQETVSNLEREIHHYKTQLSKPTVFTEVKRKYNDTIQLLENTIRTLRHELSKQNNLNKEILRNKQLSDDRLKEIEKKLEEKEQVVDKCKKTEASFGNFKCQMGKVMRANADLENSLKVAKCLIGERLNREKDTLQKVQEALNIAESAIAEKDDAINRERTIRDECNHLATTIGQVMEDAALKVEKNMDEIKNQYNGQIKKLITSQNELKRLLDNQRKQTNLAEIRANTLEQKLKDVVKDNVTLDADLQVASQAIIEMELKLGAIENLLDHDQKTNKISEEAQRELQAFLFNNKQLKERWKSTIEEITSKLQNEITNLQKENTTLKVENQDLRLKICKLNND